MWGHRAAAITNINYNNKCVTTTAAVVETSRASPPSKWTGDGSLSPHAFDGSFSPLQSPCCPTMQLTPSMVGNLNRFGWRTAATAAGYHQKRRSSETRLPEVDRSGGRRGVSSDVSREGPPLQWARSKTPSISPVGAKSRRTTKGLPRHLSIETEHPAEDMMCASPSTVASPGT